MKIITLTDQFGDPEKRELYLGDHSLINGLNQSVWDKSWLPHKLVPKHREHFTCPLLVFLT